MPTVSRFEDEVDVGSDMRFEKKWWKFERGMWVVMGLIIIAAFVGLMGRGPVARTSGAVPGVPMSVEYDRALRFATPSKVAVWLTGDAFNTGNEVRIWVNQRLLDTLELQKSIPLPVSSHSARDGMVLTFRFEPKGGWERILFSQASEKEGFIEAQIALSTNQPFTFTQFTFP